MTESPLRLSLLQFAPALLDVAGNAQRIAEAAERAASGLLLTPELSLTGYDLGDDAAGVACAPESLLPGPLRGWPDLDVVVGRVEVDALGRLHNVAVAARAGEPRFRHRKIYLPTYGMFDEARFFARGEAVRCWAHDGGWRIGLLVCEDFWHPALPYLLAADGADLLLVQAAGPGRGAWRGGAEGGRFASAEAWERIARTTAQLHGVYLALANRVGVEGGLTFAGGSVIVAPDGEVVARAPDDGDALLSVELSRDEVRRARRPYAHVRDDDLRLVAAELGRLLRART